MTAARKEAKNWITIGCKILSSCCANLAKLLILVKAITRFMHYEFGIYQIHLDVGQFYPLGSVAFPAV